MKKSLVNWLDLPRDVTIQIFMKLTTLDLLYNAQLVCSSWRAIAAEPQFYLAVDFRGPRKYFEHKGLEKVESMASLAIDRSGGRLVALSVEYFCTDLILNKLMHKSPQLRCLRLANCRGFHEGCLIELLQKLPLLEEVQFFLHVYSRDLIQAIGQSNLKSFRMNGWGWGFSKLEIVSNEWLEI